MPKHWGLQYQERMRKFADEFTNSRLAINDAESDIAIAEGDLRVKREDRQACFRANKDTELAIQKLMEIGPSGLAKLEGASGPPFTVTQMLAAIRDGRL